MCNYVETCKGHGSYNVTQSFCPDVIVSKIDFSGKNFKCHYLEFSIYKLQELKILNNLKHV